ncbi:hypothetical protein QBC44DRAFT_388442 [Cladorrhinum sp. PSN332]|nr:hypothetical protein QBC44DRAFT_388442 [Cladorrhinum sp. PSN332]
MPRSSGLCSAALSKLSTPNTLIFRTHSHISLGLIQTRNLHLAPPELELRSAPTMELPMEALMEALMELQRQLSRSLERHFLISHAPKKRYQFSIPCRLNSLRPIADLSSHFKRGQENHDGCRSVPTQCYALEVPGVFNPITSQQQKNPRGRHDKVLEEPFEELLEEPFEELLEFLDEVYSFVKRLLVELTYIIMLSRLSSFPSFYHPTLHQVSLLHTNHHASDSNPSRLPDVNLNGFSPNLGNFDLAEPRGAPILSYPSHVTGLGVSDCSTIITRHHPAQSIQTGPLGNITRQVLSAAFASPDGQGLAEQSSQADSPRPSNAKFTCPHCPTTFTEKRSLQRHQKRKHDPARQQPAFYCPDPQCPRSDQGDRGPYADAYHLKRHIKESRKCRNGNSLHQQQASQFQEAVNNGSPSTPQDPPARQEMNSSSVSSDEHPIDWLKRKHKEGFEALEARKRAWELEMEPGGESGTLSMKGRRPRWIALLQVSGTWRSRRGKKTDINMY